MTRWKYTLNSGSALREAIDNDDLEQVVKCLLLCYQELLDKLDEWDEQDYEFDIQVSVGVLQAHELYHDEDDEECVDDYLEEFYDLCDELRAWIET